MDVVEIAVSVFLIVFAYILRELSVLKKNNVDHESRLKVEESKGTARDEVASEIKTLLHDIAGDISSIKQEQGYWRGRHEQEQS